MKNRVKKLLKKTIKLFNKGKALHQISVAIQEAQDLTKELSDLRKRYKLMIHSNNTGAANTGANIDPRLLDMYKDVTELIGIEKERDELIQSLTEDGYKSKQNLKTISIVGFGGLGKTTLAKAVYNKIKVEFDCGAFVSVSRTPDVKRILKDILYDLDKDKFQNIHSTTRGENLLIDELREFLEDKRYLIMIDDIWDVKTWGIIKCALCGNNLGSRIITTTHNVNVSEACHSSGDDIIHRMKPLSTEESKRLFYRRIFPSETGCPHELQEVSKGILKKCGGVPLAIITVASLLSSNQNRMSKDHWCHVLKSIWRGITEDAIVGYYDLPSHLKTCLLYLSILPEDYKIERHRLIWRWIAEGFIHHGKQGKGLFEVGESYFNELVNRSMIQPADMNYEGKAYFCRVHDMVLDLICSLSREENFVAIWDANGQSIHESQSNFRRLSLQNISMAELGTPQLGTMNMSQVRSFSLFMVDINPMPSLSCFQVLRVLDLEGCHSVRRKDKIYLRHLGSVLHLKYLGLNRTHVSELPIEIGNLQILQTLDIRRTYVRELPSSVFQLRKLMRLCINSEIKLPAASLGNLVSLQELSTLNVDNFSGEELKELGSLTELRFLMICFSCKMDENQDKALAESINKCKNCKV